MEKEIQEKIDLWLSNEFNKETHEEIKKIQASGDEKELYDRFYKNLDFGTGGLRAKMGAGNNRINIYTIAMATQGLANYIKSVNEQAAKKGVVIAYDSRNNSALFAMRAAMVLAGNGIKAYLFKELRPTPLLSFAIKNTTGKSSIFLTELETA